MKCCEECAKLSHIPLPPQYGCNDCYDLLRIDAGNLKSRLADAENALSNSLASLSLGCFCIMSDGESECDCCEEIERIKIYQAKYKIKEKDE
jgi:hypothetical protein